MLNAWTVLVLCGLLPCSHGVAENILSAARLDKAVLENGERHASVISFLFSECLNEHFWGKKEPRDVALQIRAEHVYLYMHMSGACSPQHVSTILEILIQISLRRVNAHPKAVGLVCQPPAPPQIILMWSPEIRGSEPPASQPATL